MSTGDFPIGEALWLQEFERKIKTKGFEQFSILLFDYKAASTEQKCLLGYILFENQLSPLFWNNYITFAFENFKERKSHLQRLINKALEILDEKSFLSNRDYLRIHLNSISLKR
jgi:hypothetical protein